MCFRRATRCRFFRRFRVVDSARAPGDPNEERKLPMHHVLSVGCEPIDEPKLVSERRLSKAMGAVVYFCGVVRGSEGEAAISGLHYEAFQAMACHQFELLFAEVETRWPVESIRLVHRIGPVQVGEASLWVEVIAPHRGEAFAACQYLIDEMKKRVPIWKKPLPI